MPARDRLKEKIAQIDALIADGTLSGEAARSARAKLEEELLAAVLTADAPTPAEAQPAVAGSRPAVATAVPQAAEAGPARTHQRVGPPRRLVIGTALFVLVFASAGYAWLGNSAGLAVGPGSPATATADAGGEAAPHSTQKEQIDAMIEKLAARLKEKPDDPEGWSMLGRSYNAQGRQAEALAAYKKALDLRPQDAQAMADYADALAVANNRSLDGEPERLILKAVQLDPANVKALALAGTVAFNRSDFAAAVGYWDRAVAQSDPQGEFTRQLQGALSEARQRAGMAPADSAPGAPAFDIMASGPAASAGAAPDPAATAVSGKVSLSAAAKAQVSPDDTVFIFARAVNGPKMPLAILRKKVSDLPLDFSLDDSMAMSPAARLSSAQQVVVGARVSKTGSAMPGPGDWQGLSTPQKPGARGIRIEISEAVR